MLRLFLGELPEQYRNRLVEDVEKEFETFSMSGSSLERLFLTRLEQGSYNPEDDLSYIDRFGFKLHRSQMSNGCKAALCVLHSPDKIISLAECGLNARDMILSFCKDGAVFLKDCGITVVDYSGKAVRIQLDDYIFSSIERLNYYIFRERPWEPDMLVKGVERVSVRQIQYKTDDRIREWDLSI